MTITFVLAGGFNLSGGDRVIAIYAERLQQRGHRVFVIAAPAYGPGWRAHLRSLVRTRRMAARPVPGPSHIALTSVPHRRIERLRPIVDADLPDADVVISTWWETAEWVAALSPRKGVKVAFLQHYEAFDYTPKQRVDATWRLPLHKIVVSRWLAEVARDFGDAEVSLVPNAVDTRQFHAPERARNTAPTVGMVYSSTPWKGAELGLRAIERVKQTLPDLRLVTFGAEPVAPHLTLPPYATHTVTPAQDRLRDIYASADVWLCASHTEGFCLPLLESMACRTPVVATRVGGAVDLIEDGVNGYVVPVHDEAALAERLSRVLRLPAQRWRDLSNAAHRTATSHSWDDATDQFETALRRALERHQRGELAASRSPLSSLRALAGR